jgi:hypothetical protein
MNGTRTSLGTSSKLFERFDGCMDNDKIKRALVYEINLLLLASEKCVGVRKQALV